MAEIRLLFACIANSCRSQMAEALARKYISHKIKIQSAGTNPAPTIHPLAIQVMQEVGIDISSAQPKLLTQKMLNETTHFISMGCGVQEACPFPLFSVIVENWNLPDPAGKDLAFFRKIRCQIKEKIIIFRNKVETSFP